jgi:bifunctional DNA-binding transcriptional regulator/antitoxin component of YhaV-PrlF toxin-antitoxin module
MPKVTSKLQVTVPKALAERYAIRPGDEIAWEAAGDVIRVVPRGRPPAPGAAARLRLFDKATERQRRRDRAFGAGRTAGRGWTREELYDRGRAR